MITIETIINAPIDQVWKAFNSPEDIVKWNQASDDWHCPKAENDFSTEMQQQGWQAILNSFKNYVESKQ
ncbi:SRPBCC domain-containing protein [Empedobacter tilapiae]